MMGKSRWERSDLERIVLKGFDGKGVTEKDCWEMIDEKKLMGKN